MIKKIISTRRYKVGYEIRTEEVQLEGCAPCIAKNAYTKAGEYIGSSKWAHRLYVKFGIVPERISEEWGHCAIGFCESEQKWYGWSRGMYGFGVGFTVNRGDCGYTSSSTEELVEEYKRWNDVVEIIDAATIKVSCKMCIAVGENPDGSIVLEDAHEMESYTVRVGRGEWTARTLEDARQMACDFAEDGA